MENQSNELRVIESNETALYLLTKAEIDTQISTAKAFPRSIKEFYSKAISMATVSEDVAASCTYALPRAGKIIEGASVRLAEIVCSSFGNIRAGARVIYNDGKTITAQGICHDLENNYCATVEVKRRITTKSGQTFNDDMQTMAGNAACSIAYRNAVFKIVPMAIVGEIEDKAKEVARGTVATLSTRRDRAIEFFESLKITRVVIFTFLGVKGVEEIDLDKLAILTGIKTAIKNEGANAKDIFNPKPETQPQPTGAEVEHARKIAMLQSCKTIADLDFLEKNNPDFDFNLIESRRKELIELLEKYLNHEKTIEQIQLEQKIKVLEQKFDSLDPKDSLGEKGQTILFEIDELKALYLEL